MNWTIFIPDTPSKYYYSGFQDYMRKLGIKPHSLEASFEQQLSSLTSVLVKFRFEGTSSAGFSVKKSTGLRCNCMISTGLVKIISIVLRSSA